MTIAQIIALIFLSVYYIAYITKMLVLRKRGISAGLLGKGEKSSNELIIEKSLRSITIFGAAIQFRSVLLPWSVWTPPVFLPVQITGLALMLLGNLFFIAAMLTMRNNWRAGFERNQNTNLVTNGIYKFSRNPAFVGFDLLYIGCSAAFPNIVNITAAIICVVLFHVQILGEEKFCALMFGKEYESYTGRVNRYLGRRIKKTGDK